MQKIIKYTLDQLLKTRPTLTEEERQFLAEGENKSARKKYSIYEFVTMLSSGHWFGGHVNGLGYISENMFTKIESDSSDIEIFVPTSPSDSFPVHYPEDPDETDASSDADIPPLSSIKDMQMYKRELNICGDFTYAVFSGNLTVINDYYAIALNSVKGEKFYADIDTYIFLTIISRYHDPEHKIAGVIPAGFDFVNDVCCIGTSISFKNENDSFSLYLYVCEGGTSEYNECNLISRQLIFQK